MTALLRSAPLAAAIAAVCVSSLTAQFVGPATATQYPFALTPVSEYKSTFFITPNGNAPSSAPMVRKLLGAGDPAYLGGGRYAKAGIQAGLFYTRFTEGAAGNWEFYINRGPNAYQLPLPPDVTSITQLPAIVRLGPDLTANTADDLASWATIGKMPMAIAALEWARYCDVPISFQMQATGPQGGAIDAQSFDLDRFVESQGKNHCAWDVSDKCDPLDDNPATYEGANTTDGANYSYATPTMAPPELAVAVLGHTLPYQSLLKRNLQMGIQQLLAIASDPRYGGRVVAIAIDPEVHYATPEHPKYPLPKLGGTTTIRPMVSDYNPVVIAAFQAHLQARYGDSSPTTDSNGDGATFMGDFGSDYLASGGFGHAHTTPTTWTDIDAPRNYPMSLSTPRTPLWHEWVNFRVELCDLFVERLVGWAIEAGMPADRVFTHQTYASASYNDNRANWSNAEWLDDWSHVEASGGMSGLSMYQASNLTDGLNIYGNLQRRDDSWGSPEFNPYIIDPTVFPPTVATPAQIQSAVSNTWTFGAQVLWPHFWEGISYPVTDIISARWVHASNGSLGDVVNGAATWTTVNMTQTQSNLLSTAPPPNSYILSPTVSLNAAEYKFLYVEMQASSLLANEAGPLRCDFQTLAGGSTTWYSVSTADLLRLTGAVGQFVLDMSVDPNWIGTITRLRLFPNKDINYHSYLESLSLVRQNQFTIEMQNLLVAKKDVQRPVATNTYSAPLPILLADQIAPAVTARNLVVYGTDPVSPGVFSDFGTANNFFAASVACGGLPAEPAIVEPAAQLLGMAKTGKFRRLALPNVPDLHLDFAVGIQDGFTSTDGVAFRVVLRDQDRALHELFAKEWRWNRWSNRFYIDLDPWKGQTVDLAFEVRGIAKTTNDRSIWRSPRIEQVVVKHLSTAIAGQGQVTGDVAADYPVGTVVPLNAVAAPGWIFTNWTTTGLLTDIASPTSASTTITMNGPHTVTAHFTALTTSTFQSLGAEDGWIRETVEGSGIGGTMNATQSDLAAIQVGDDTADRVLRSILSFDTASIPDNATIVSVTVRLVRSGQRGTPFTSLGNLNVGVVGGFFGTANALELADFRSAPTGLVTPAATLSAPATDGATSSGTFSAAGAAAVSKTGRTQVRLGFGITDNDNAANDTILFFSGENATAANRPVLEVVWY